MKVLDDVSSVERLGSFSTTGKRVNGSVSILELKSPDQWSFVRLTFFLGASPFPGIAVVGLVLWHIPRQHGIKDRYAELQKDTYIEWAASRQVDRENNQVDYECQHRDCCTNACIKCIECSQVAKGTELLESCAN